MKKALLAAAIVSFGLTLTAKAEAPVNTNQQAWTIYAKYLEGWKSVSDEQRKKIAEEILDEKIQYLTRNHDLSTGRRLVIEDMESFQKKFPGGHFEIGDVSSHHDVALLTWVLVQADGKVFAKGPDQIRFSKEGKILSITTFPPSATTP